MDGYLAEIRMFSGTYAPRNWMFCQGGELNIAEYSPLFALIGVTYGGDGYVKFKVPDFRGRIPYGLGQGPGLSENHLGEKKGWEETRIPLENMPAHTHVTNIYPPQYSGVAKPKCFKGMGSGNTDPENRFAGPSPSTEPIYYDTDSIDMGSMDIEVTRTGNYSLTLEETGNGGMFSIMQPSLCVNFIICIDGNWPPRN